MEMEEIKMLQIAIVEDEDKWADMISDFLEKYEKEFQEKIQSKRFQDGYELVDGYTGKFDIILMDIEMGLMNGMEAAEQIRLKDEQVIIIFITNMAQYALQGYKVNATDYILKPVKYIAFSQSLKKAARSLKKSKESYLIISMREETKKIKVSEIGWIESCGHRLTFHVGQNCYETTVYSMKEMEQRLSTEGFKRCSSGCLVNLNRVQGISSNMIEIDGEHVTVSRGRKNEFMASLASFLTE